MILRRIKILLCMLLLSCGLLFADSFTLQTTIRNVASRGDIGMGLFPVGTYFTYSDSFQMIKDKPSAFFQLYTGFTFDDVTYGSFSWDTGIPYWSLKQYEQNSSHGFNDLWVASFRPSSFIDLLVQQGFGTNPVSKAYPLANVWIGLYTRYAQFFEPISYSANGSYGGGFVDGLGELRHPFTEESIPAFPWLQGNRKLWNNHIYIGTSWYFNKYVALNSSEGVTADVQFEYGPWWLGNNVSPKGKTSDFYRFSASLSENLPIYTKTQENGWNWFNIVLGHSNSYSYVGGDIVPEHRIPGDRLRSTLSDSLWLIFSGPQFVAGDCYSFFQLTLNNYLYFGHVVNEASQDTTAIEFQSDLSGVFHLRLFGFMNFQYSMAYAMARGIHAGYPSWTQRADLLFYVSI